MSVKTNRLTPFHSITAISKDPALVSLLFEPEMHTARFQLLVWMMTAALLREAKPCEDKPAQPVGQPRQLAFISMLALLSHLVFFWKNNTL